MSFMWREGKQYIAHRDEHFLDFREGEGNEGASLKSMKGFTGDF